MPIETALQDLHQRLQALYCRRTAEQRGLLLIQTRLRAINAQIEEAETQLSALQEAAR